MNPLFTNPETEAVNQTETFLAMVVTNDRSTVLAALSQQAVDHFGHSQLQISNVRVTAAGYASALLASGDFALLRP
jgi:hypothetical protein